MVACVIDIFASTFFTDFHHRKTMKKTLSKVAVLASAVLLSAVPLWASVADNFPVPASDPLGLRGATVPYTRYDCNSAGDARLSGGAVIKTSPDWNPYNKASQASNQAYVDMPVGSSVAWTMKTYGDGVTIRYTIKDSNVGSSGYADGYKTSDGQLEVYVNGQKKATVDLTSYFMYQYFPSGHPAQGPDGRPCFVFDEKHVSLGSMAKEGDTIEIKCISGDEVGVDFIETEVVPEAIEASEAAAGRQVFNVVDYGASTSSTNNVPAFNKAISAANAVGGVVYIPKGTWLLGEMWSLAGHNIKITGAGMWHTNLQFTGYKPFGGGISGGNPSNGPFKSNQCDNIEFCNVYINSNLCDRYDQQAVYKCFMDIWCGGSVIHDVWEEHFETGFWFGDYNSSTRRCSDGVRIVNCRIRNNYADGVNFCQGTSEAAVFNCNIRNCGDDGLACWNNNEGVKDEYGNIFCFNTIDHIWRAGAIALYGGIDHKIYNNYISDTFMASGIHLNTNFPGPKFQNITADHPVIIENNTLVRCGTMSDSWNESLGAIDLIQNLKHIILRNNSVFESPADALRTLTGPENITIDGLYINGSGLSKASDEYSCVHHSFAAGRIEDANAIKFSNVRVVKGSIPAATEGANQDSFKTWPWWSHAPSDWQWTDEDIDTPVYPDSKGIIPVPDPFDTLTGYDLVMTGIDWRTQSDKHSMYDGDKVSFRLRLDNKGTASIPDGAKFTVVFSIDGTSSFSVIVRDGFAANSSRIIEIPSTWTATKGMHTFTATVDPSGKCKNDANRANNVRVKDVNVNEIPEGEDPEIEINTHSGSDMGVVKVWFENLTSGDDDVISVGDILRPHAIVANYGSETVTLGSGQGVLWGLEASPEYMTGMLWDDSSHTLAPGQWIEVTPNGGGNFAVGGFNEDGTVTAKNGTVTLVCRMDNPTKYNDNESSNNMLSASFTYPKTRPQYNENPDRADNLVTGGLWDYEDTESPDAPDVTGFDLVPTHIFWEPGTKEVQAGKEIYDFTVRLSNISAVDFPADIPVKVTVNVDGRTIGSATYSDGIYAGEYYNLNIDGSFVTTAGAHTVRATVTPVAGESDRTNNSRERTFNALSSAAPEPATFAVNPNAANSSLDFVIDRVEWFKETQSRADGDNVIRPGDKLRFRAYVRNNSTLTSPANTKHGIQWQMPAGNTSDIIWSDEHQGKPGVAPGETIVLTSMGGKDNGLWTAKAGTTTVRAWFNDTHDLGQYECQFDFPVTISDGSATVTYHENPLGDDKNISTAIDTISSDNLNASADVWYNLSGIRIQGRPMFPGIYIHNGKKVMVK